MTKIGDLAFDFEFGACNSFSKFGILFCFEWTADQECHSFSISKTGTLTIKQEISSKYDHDFALSLASYRGSPFVTGGGSPDHSKTELLNINEMQWETKANYPLSRYFGSFK